MTSYFYSSFLSPFHATYGRFVFFFFSFVLRSDDTPGQENKQTSSIVQRVITLINPIQTFHLSDQTLPSHSHPIEYPRPSPPSQSPLTSPRP